MKNADKLIYFRTVTVKLIVGNLAYHANIVGVCTAPHPKTFEWSNINPVGGKGLCDTGEEMYYICKAQCRYIVQYFSMLVIIITPSLCVCCDNTR